MGKIGENCLFIMLSFCCLFGKRIELDSPLTNSHVFYSIIRRRIIRVILRTITIINKIITIMKRTFP